MRLSNSTQENRRFSFSQRDTLITRVVHQLITMTSIASAQHQVNPVQSGHHTSVEHWHGHVNDNRRQEFFDEWEAEAEPVVWATQMQERGWSRMSGGSTRKHSLQCTFIQVRSMHVMQRNKSKNQNKTTAFPVPPVLTTWMLYCPGGSPRILPRASSFPNHLGTACRESQRQQSLPFERNLSRALCLPKSF